MRRGQTPVNDRVLVQVVPTLLQNLELVDALPHYHPAFVYRSQYLFPSLNLRRDYSYRKRLLQYEGINQRYQPLFGLLSQDPYRLEKVPAVLC